MVSDFSEIKHVFGDGFSGYRLGFPGTMDRIFDTVIGFQVFRIRSTLLVIAVSDKAYWLIGELKAIFH